MSRAEKKSLIRSIFSLITLFTLNDKEKQNEQIDNLKTLMDFYGLPVYKNSQLISQYYIQNDGWKTDKIDEIVHSVKDRSFFCRFSKQHIKHFMKFMRCKRFKKDEVIFVESEV